MRSESGEELGKTRQKGGHRENGQKKKRRGNEVFKMGGRRKDWREMMI